MEVSRYGIREGKWSPQLVEKWEAKGHQFRFYCPETILEVSVFDSHILRFRYSPEGRFEEDFSYALAFDGIPSAPDCFFEIKDQGDVFEIHTDVLFVTVSRSLHVKIYDKEGTLISEDERGFHWQPADQHGGDRVYCTKKIQEKENFYGLGDKPGQFNLRGSRFETWATDAYGYEKTSDPLYKNIPFFMGLHHNKGYGIFFDNTFRTRLDFGYERSDICSFWSPGGEMNYYFIYGPSLNQVTEGYAYLTGVPELPPLWALGYHQSRWSYSNIEEVREVADRLREEQIPCDVIHIDIDYMDEFRCFTWDEKKFPDPKGLHAELEAVGFKTMVILDPGIKIDPDYEVYKEGLKKDVFCRREDGPIMRGKLWPGQCFFPDFTNPKVREWWGSLFEKFMQCGTRGIWNDMNEPAVLEVGTFPLDTRHNFDGNPCSHKKAHNVYGMQMARASYHGVKNAIYPYRPFLITRSGYAGFQRYAGTWTGDNQSTWEHLWIANIQCQRLSVSGVSFSGSDIGGFFGRGNGELLTRWMQMGVFHPFFRNHSSGDHGDQEPWSFGEPYTSAIRKAIELRYQFLPYVYTTFWRHIQKGTPMIQPLVFLAQDDPETYYRMDEFGLGKDVLICPILNQGVEGRRLYLPKGTWYNYWTGEVETGQRELWVSADLDTFPLFIRGGAIIPHHPVMQYVGEQEVETLTLNVYLDEGPSTSELYEDAGDYYDHDQGNFMIRTFTLTYEKDRDQVSIKQLKSGRFNSPAMQFLVKIYGLTASPQEVVVDGIPFYDDFQFTENVCFFTVDKNFEEIWVKS
ncbi:MAG: glycoside hydrolase family 31 protein [Bacteroidota bacterium]